MQNVSACQLSRYNETHSATIHGLNFFGHVTYVSQTITLSKYCKTFDTLEYFTRHLYMYVANRSKIEIDLQYQWKIPRDFIRLD